MKRGGYSVGAVYITICNNPRSVRFRREETLLYCVIPGPTEPTTEHLNKILGPAPLDATEGARDATVGVLRKDKVVVPVARAALPCPLKLGGIKNLPPSPARGRGRLTVG